MNFSAKLRKIRGLLKSTIKRSFAYNIEVGSIHALSKILLVCLVATEVWRLIKITVEKILPYIVDKINEKILIGIAIALILYSIYTVLPYLWQIIKNKRLDILAAGGFGVLINVVWGGFWIDSYSKFINSYTAQQVLVICLAPFVVLLLINVRLLLINFFYKKSESKFVADRELKEVEEDLLNFKEKAFSFAEHVYNNAATESIVFGIDAPWGIGKSSFINLCIKRWKEKDLKDNVIVYKFTPLTYLGDKPLFEFFIDGLIQEIQKDAFVPEIKPLFTRYTRLLKGAGSVLSFFKIEIPIFLSNYSIDDAFFDLSCVLERSNKKIIIVVDDLDRIEFSEIKNVLFVVRKSFALPNISYVLCYDTDNIMSGGMDSEKVSEFLEKFINIKISLYLNAKYLAQYVSENLERVLSTSTSDPILVRQCVGGLLDIYKSPSYHEYLPFIGDIRKLKRLINTVVLFDLQGIDFKNSDFDKSDLIHLLLIYIHYPNIFRKIFDTETDGRNGFFSFVMPYDDNYPKSTTNSHSTETSYKNSALYSNFIEKLPKEGKAVFLLEKVFNVNQRLSNAQIDSVPEEVRTSLACFNGGWRNGRNLEQYLKLIVDLVKPDKIGQHKFFTSIRDRVLENQITLDELFTIDEFRSGHGEDIHEKMWNVLVNNARKFDKKISDQLIIYTLNHSRNYSFLKFETLGIGIRHNFDYFLVRLLNDCGWIDSTGKRIHNTSNNVKEIADWIYGEGSHGSYGIIQKLYQDENILGLYDILAFRLFCCVNRGGDIFNVARALLVHADPTTTDSNLNEKEEMREISQYIFKIFKKQYIDKKINIFDNIEVLDNEQLAGDSLAYLEENINKEELEREVLISKNRITGFIVYQIGNTSTSLGIGCGNYDLSGKKDTQEIRKIFNQYLFSVCFKPGKNTKNIEYFLDYLLSNFGLVSSPLEESANKFVSNINEFTKALDQEMLSIFWENNGTLIKGLNLDKKTKIIHTINYTASYDKDLLKVYEVLDTTIKTSV